MPGKTLRLVVFFCFVGAAWAAPLTQCPPRTVAGGVYTGCNFLMTLNPDGSLVTALDASQPFFGGEDSYAGFQNNSLSTVSSIIIDGVGVSIFALDRDGPGSAMSSLGFCPTVGTGLTGYEGPGVTFSNVNADCTGGQVNFGPPLAPGASAYFFLEEAVSAPLIPKGTVGPTAPAVPECGTSVLGATSLIFVFWKRFRQRTGAGQRSV